MPIIAVTLLVATGTACEDNSPEAVAARAWAKDIEPLLHENSLLAEQVLEGAAEIYNGQPDAAAATKRWRDNVVPVAQHLQHQAELVEPPPVWAEPHTVLVATWTDRAGAYTDILVALETGDKELWTAGRKRSDSAKLAEEKWFQDTNKALSAYDIALDQFP